MSYKTRLSPPPANGWVPPALPPLPDPVVSEEQGVAKDKQTSVKKSRPLAKKMVNLFEEAPVTLFDEVEVEAEYDEEFEEEVEEPLRVPLGRVRVNGVVAQLMSREELENGNVSLTVILEETGVEKKYVSPPARVEEME